MKQQRDHYDVLGLKSNADGSAVNQAYWHLARKYQTLAITDPRARLMLDDLNEAYAVLGTPTKREDYDEQHRDTFKRADGLVKRRRPRTRAKAVAAPLSVAAAAPVAHPVAETRAETHAPVQEHMAEPGDADRSSATRLRWGIAAATAVAVAGLGAASLLDGAGVVILAGAAAALLALGAAFGVRRLLAGQAEAVAERDITEHTTFVAPRSARLTQAPAAAAPGRTMSANDLVASTSAMRGRWRDAVAPMLGADDADHEPDLTLVDIFESEREVETDGEPLNAVMDILRGSRATVELH